MAREWSKRHIKEMITLNSSAGKTTEEKISGMFNIMKTLEGVPLILGEFIQAEKSSIITSWDTKILTTIPTNVPGLNVGRYEPFKGILKQYSTKVTEPDIKDNIQILPEQPFYKNPTINMMGVGTKVVGNSAPKMYTGSFVNFHISCSKYLKEEQHNIGEWVPKGARKSVFLDRQQRYQPTGYLAMTGRDFDFDSNNILDQLVAQDIPVDTPPLTIKNITASDGSFLDSYFIPKNGVEDMLVSLGFDGVTILNDASSIDCGYMKLYTPGDDTRRYFYVIFNFSQGFTTLTSGMYVYLLQYNIEPTYSGILSRVKVEGLHKDRPAWNSLNIYNTYKEEKQ